MLKNNNLSKVVSRVATALAALTLSAALLVTSSPPAFAVDKLPDAHTIAIIKAPKTDISITLKKDDPPVKVMLERWYQIDLGAIVQYDVDLSGTGMTAKSGNEVLRVYQTTDVSTDFFTKLGIPWDVTKDWLANPAPGQTLKHAWKKCYTYKDLKKLRYRLVRSAIERAVKYEERIKRLEANIERVKKGIPNKKEILTKLKKKKKEIEKLGKDIGYKERQPLPSAKTITATVSRETIPGEAKEKVPGKPKGPAIEDITPEGEGGKNVVTGGGPKDMTIVGRKNGGGKKKTGGGEGGLSFDTIEPTAEEPRWIVAMSPLDTTPTNVVTGGKGQDIVGGKKKKKEKKPVTGGGATASGKLPDAHTITITVSRDKAKGKEVAGGGGETAIGGGGTDGKGPEDIVPEGGLSLPAGRTITVSASHKKKEGKGPVATPGGKGPEDIVPEGGLNLPAGRTITVSASHKKKDEKAAGQTISGRVLSTEDKPISGAIVSVEIGNKMYKGTSSADGGYRVAFPNDIQIPDQLIITADKGGFNTASRIVKKKDFRKADIKLSEVSEDVIQIDKTLHHLGNSNYGGAINSQFQRPEAEAANYRKEFQIPGDRLSGSTMFPTKLKMTVKGAEEENPILINGKKVGVLGTSNTDGSATNMEIDVDPCVLKAGKNILTVTSADSNRNNDIDDFEFANIQLIFESKRELSPGDKGLAKLNSIRVMDPGFRQGIKEVEGKGKFSIEAKGKGGCEGLKDIALVEVFPKGKGESSAIRVRLVETGSNTSIFRSESPISVAGLGVKAGERIIVRAGVRGTSVTVKGMEEKGESWTVYKLKVERGAGVPRISVVEIGFHRKGDTAELSQWVYPVSHIKDETTGKTLWNIQWYSGSPLTAVERTLERTAAEELSRRAEGLRKGGTSKAGLKEEIAKVLGQKARPLYDDWQTRGLERKEVKRGASSKVSEAEKKVKKQVSGKKTEKTASTVSKPSKKRKTESPGTIPVMGGSRKLKAGIPVKVGPPSKEDRCASLKEIKQRIDKGERPRLIKRTYRAPNGETFEMIETSEDPLFKGQGLEETDSQGFIIFSRARKALDVMITKLGCR